MCFQLNQVITATVFYCKKIMMMKEILERKYDEIPANCYLQVGSRFVSLAVPVSQEGRLQ